MTPGRDDVLQRPPGADAGWRRSFEDLVRGASGGMLLGIPLLFTMEVWWIGGSSRPSRILAVLVFSFVPVVLLTRTSGFRSVREVRLVDAAMDSVDAVALGVVCVTAILFLLREITATTPLAEALGKIVYEALPFALGVALARHFLQRGRDEGDEDSGGQSTRSTADTGVNATLVDVGATVVGAVFVAFNIAPTDEVPMLAAAISPGWLLGIVLASLAISYGIVFVAGFSSQEKRRTQRGVFQHPLTETVVCYLVSLVSAAFISLSALLVGDIAVA